MSPKASQSQFSKLIRSIYYLDNKNINMFGFDNNRIVANQGPEVSNSQTETCPTNPEGIMITGEPGLIMGQLSQLTKNGN